VANVQIPTTPNSGEGVQQQELLFNAGGNAKWLRHFEKRLVVSCKAKHIQYIIQPSRSLIFTQTR
jgi:hypothetical protein